MLDALVPAMLDAFGDVAPGKQRGGEADERHQQQDQRAEPVARQPFARRRRRGRCGRLPAATASAKPENDRGGQERDGRGEAPAERQQRQSAGEQRDDKNADELHDVLNAPVSDASCADRCGAQARVNPAGQHADDERDDRHVDSGRKLGDDRQVRNDRHAGKEHAVLDRQQVRAAAAPLRA